MPLNTYTYWFYNIKKLAGISKLHKFRFVCTNSNIWLRSETNTDRYFSEPGSFKGLWQVIYAVLWFYAAYIASLSPMFRDMSVQYIRVNESSSIDGRCTILLLLLMLPVVGVVPNASEMSWILRMPQRTVFSQIRVQLVSETVWNQMPMNVYNLKDFSLV